MAFIANKVARGFIERNAKQYEPVDPFYEYYVDASGKEKRRKVCAAEVARVADAG
jgi:hypothetical protein